MIPSNGTNHSSLLASAKSMLWRAYVAWWRGNLRSKLEVMACREGWLDSEATQDLERLANLPQCNTDCASLYLMIRISKPRFILETGVGTGHSTHAILLALKRLGEGRLVSVDATRLLVAEGVDVHYIAEKFCSDVPINLRERWTLLEERAEVVLPRLAAEWRAVGQTVDVFVRDSWHVADAVRFEFDQILPIMTKGGWLISHDADSFGNKPAFRHLEKTYPVRRFFFGKGSEYRVYRILKGGCKLRM